MGKSTKGSSVGKGGGNGGCMADRDGRGVVLFGGWTGLK